MQLLHPIESELKVEIGSFGETANVGLSSWSAFAIGCGKCFQLKVGSSLVAKVAMLDKPVPIRTLKFGNVWVEQYLDGRSLGNSLCF